MSSSTLPGHHAHPLPRANLGGTRIGQYFVEWPSAPDDRTLGVVDFSIFPHLDAFPTNILAHAERWAADLGVPAYAIDEQTAIMVLDGSVDVVSEGKWTKFEA